MVLLLAESETTPAQGRQTDETEFMVRAQGYEEWLPLDSAAAT